MSRVVIGVDEVGRGCLAGPVYAAALILPEPYPDWVAEVQDSKKVSPSKREFLAEQMEDSCRYSIQHASAAVIDEMNILYATLWAMGLAVDDLYERYGGEIEDAVVLIDGNKTIPTEAEAGPGWLRAPWKQISVVDGDNLEKSIGAASILAKVSRDRYMREDADLLYPEYGFAQHVGYGTKQHREAIQQVGPSEIHRKSFSGVYQYVKGS